MKQTDLTVLNGRNAAAMPLRISVTDSAQELLALETLVRQAIPMLENPMDFCTGKRMRLAGAAKLAKILAEGDETADGDQGGGDEEVKLAGLERKRQRGARRRADKRDGSHGPGDGFDVFGFQIAPRGGKGAERRREFVGGRGVDIEARKRRCA